MRSSPLFLLLLLLPVVASFSPLSAQWIQDGNKFSGTGAVGTAGQGNAVAISADSTTIIVGASADSGGFGTVWVFFRGATSWGQQGSKLVPTDPVGKPAFGSSVAVSADGNTAIIGGRSDNNVYGAAWIFIRSGNLWTQQGGKLLGTGMIGGAYQGSSVGISADGNTVIVGGPSDSSSTGAVWIFVRSGGVWSQEGTKLVGSGHTGAAYQGYSVALSSDGNTALIGGYYDNSAIGAAWVFTRTGGVWAQQGGKLVGTGYVGTSVYQGQSVALSADGNTALIGGPQDSSAVGAAWVFARSGGVWTQQGSKLVGNDHVWTIYVGGEVFTGCSVALSTDGNTALIGGYGDDILGAAWAFTRSGGVWSQQGSKIVGAAVDGTSVFGRAASLAGDGNTAVIGGPTDTHWGQGAGAFWIYSRGSGVWSYRMKGQGNGAAGEAMQGQSIAMTRDGRYAIIAGAKDYGGGGAYWSIERVNGVWTQRGSVTFTGVISTGTPTNNQWTALSGDGLTRIIGEAWYDTSRGRIRLDTVRTTFGNWASPPPIGLPIVPSTGDRIGNSVAISLDGNSIIYGAPGSSDVYAADNINGVWDKTASYLGGGLRIGSFGWAVALAGNGKTAIVGAPQYTGNAGAAYAVDRSAGGNWRTTGTNLVPTGGVGTAGQFGFSVAVSDDGNTAAIGRPADDGNRGAAFVFARIDSVWQQLGDKLVGTGATGAASQGTSVAISADGGTIAVGGPRDNSNTGAIWIFTRYNGSFAQHGTKLTGSGIIGAAQLGMSLALSRDGSICLTGAPADNSNAGAVWTFRLPVEADITSIVDVPSDQGGKVRVTWHKSEFDQPRDKNQITQYGVWRRIPPAGTLPKRPPQLPAGIMNDTLGLRYDLVATVPAVQAQTYNFVAPTLFDSSGTGMHTTWFIITAHTSDPNVYYISAMGGGYSVDNLPPAGITGASILPLPSGALALSWNPDRVDTDLKGYCIYRSTTGGFAPGTSNAIGFTTDTTYSDTSAQHGVTSYYRIAAVDLHDNAGPPSAEVNAIPVGVGGKKEEIPTEFSLSQNYPNPFNPSTTIRYGLPEKSHVSMTIYNPLGQIVSVLKETEEEAGYHEVKFDATRLSSGVYICRLSAGRSFVRTVKLLLIR